MTSKKFLGKLEASCVINNNADKPYNIFPKKVSIHPFSGAIPHLGIFASALYAGQILSSKGKDSEALLYLHMPYCSSKCSYCPFFGGTYTVEKGNQYTQAIIKEIKAEHKRIKNKKAIKAVYFGGGTPTALSPNNLVLLLKTIKEYFTICDDAEITIEGRNSDLSPELIERCLAEGVNRFSLGVQTFNTKLRRSIGRYSDEEKVVREIEMLASYGSAAVIIDLIYGIPEQSLEDWKRDLARLTTLPIDGVDLYQMNLIPGSPLAKQVQNGAVNLPAIDQRYAMFDEALRFTEHNNFKRLSISHWAKSDKERNLYNVFQKSKNDCYSYGSGAGGSFNGIFYANTRNPESYLKTIHKGKKPILLAMKSSYDAVTLSQLLRQLETLEVDFDKLHRLSGRDYLKKRMTVALDYLADAGLIGYTAKGFKILPDGQFWQMNVTQIILNALKNLC